MPTLAIARLFKIAQYRNIFIASVGDSSLLKHHNYTQNPLPSTSQLRPFFGVVSLPLVLMLVTLQLLGEAQQPVAQFWKAACG
jgi:hypothetical protein